MTLTIRLPCVFLREALVHPPVVGFSLDTDHEAPLERSPFATSETSRLVRPHSSICLVHLEDEYRENRKLAVAGAVVRGNYWRSERRSRLKRQIWGIDRDQRAIYVWDFALCIRSIPVYLFSAASAKRLSFGVRYEKRRYRRFCCPSTFP